MKSKYLRIISLTLAVCMVISCCAVPAFASGVSTIPVSISSSGFFSNGSRFLAAENRAFDDNLKVSVYAFAGESDNYIIPSGSYIDFYYGVSFGCVSNTSIGTWINSGNFAFENFSDRHPDVYNVTIYGYHNTQLSIYDVLYDGSASSWTFSTVTTKDYKGFSASISFLNATDFAADNGVFEGDLFLIYALNTKLRYSSNPIPDDSVASYVDSQVATLSAELQAHKDEVASVLTNISSQLSEIGMASEDTNQMVTRICSELAGFGNDVDAALAYLNAIAQNTASTVNALNTVQSYLSTGNTTLANILSSSMDISTDVSSVLNFMMQLCADIDTLVANSESVEAYLNSIDSKLITVSTNLSAIAASTSGADTKLSDIYSVLVSMSTDSSSIVDYLSTLCDSIGAVSENGDSVLDYLSSLDSKFTFLNEKLSNIEQLLRSGSGTGGGTASVDLSEIVSRLISVDQSLSLACSYLLSLSNACSNIDGNVSDIAAYVQASCTSMEEILLTLEGISQQIDDISAQYLTEILSNLVSQGTDLKAIRGAFNNVLGFLQAIAGNTGATSRNTTEMKTALENLLTELQTTETKIDDTNERLDAIYGLIEDFEVNIQKSVDEVYSGSDKKGLGGILSSIVSRLSSLINFVGDVFSNMLTSIPDLIGGFNDSLAFWDSAEQYEYRPYQIGIYTKDTADYTNSSSAVQTLFAEAEKYLGYPYVWGGASPETSFDCSGYVSYVLNASGVYPTSRLTAQGLYNICTPIDASQAMPGDLIFFTGTYNTSDAVTHVGFYAGDGRMLHCGDPIQYADCTTAYWTSHFYSYGRLPYNVSEPYFEIDLPQYLYFDLDQYADYGFSPLDLTVSFSDPDVQLSWYFCEDSSGIGNYGPWQQIVDYQNLSTVPASVQFYLADFLLCDSGYPVKIKCVAESNVGVRYESTVASVIYEGWEG